MIHIIKTTFIILSFQHWSTLPKSSMTNIYLIIKIKTVLKEIKAIVTKKNINYLLLKVSRLLNESIFHSLYYPNHSFKSHSLIAKENIIIKISAVSIEIVSQTKYLIDFLLYFFNYKRNFLFLLFFVKLFAITWLLFLLCCVPIKYTPSAVFSVFFFGNKWISYFLEL